GTMLPKLRLQHDSSAAGFAHLASATGNLTMPSRGKRKPRYGLNEIVMPRRLPRTGTRRQADNAPQSRDRYLPVIPPVSCGSTQHTGLPLGHVDTCSSFGLSGAPPRRFLNHISPAKPVASRASELGSGTADTADKAPNKPAFSSTSGMSASGSPAVK